MKQQVIEDFNECDIPTEDSDSAKTVRVGVFHQDKNVLVRNKGKVKQEDFSDFGIETVHVINDQEIYWNDYKVLIRSWQPDYLAGRHRLVTEVQKDNMMLDQPKRVCHPNRLSFVNSTKISSSKILELLFAKKAHN